MIDMHYFIILKKKKKKKVFLGVEVYMDYCRVQTKLKNEGRIAFPELDAFPIKKSVFTVRRERSIIQKKERR